MTGGAKERGGSATALLIADAVAEELLEVVDAAVEALVPMTPLPALDSCLVALPAGTLGLLHLLEGFLLWLPPAVAAAVPFWRFRPNGIPKLDMTGSHAGGCHRP
jgi:hypothetical protein